MAQTEAMDMAVPADQLPVKVTGMQAMASKMWMPFIGMGFMIVVAAFIIGTTSRHQRRCVKQRRRART